ncbi:MAG: hypothetical protein ACKVQR_23260 [Aquabacterium sp.]
MITATARPHRTTLCVAAAAAIAGGALLMAFHQVVAGSVVQGERHRTATALKSDRLLQCNLMSHAGERTRCHAVLPAATGTVATLHPTASD